MANGQDDILKRLRDARQQREEIDVLSRLRRSRGEPLAGLPDTQTQREEQDVEEITQPDLIGREPIAPADTTRVATPLPATPPPARPVARRDDPPRERRQAVFPQATPFPFMNTMGRLATSIVGNIQAERAAMARPGLSRAAERGDEETQRVHAERMARHARRALELQDMAMAMDPPSEAAMRFFGAGQQLAQEEGDPSTMDRVIDRAGSVISGLVPGLGAGARLVGEAGRVVARESGTVGEMVDAFTDDPVGVVKEIMLQSIPFSALSTPGAAVGGVIGGAAGAVFGRTPTAAALGQRVGSTLGLGITSGRLEFGAELIGSLQEEGVDVTDPEELIAAANSGILDRAVDRATKRGIAIGLFEGASLAAAPSVRALVPKRFVAPEAVQSLLSGTLGAGGEAAAQIVTEGGVTDLPSIAAEFLGEMAMGPVEIALDASAEQQVDRPRKEAVNRTRRAFEFFRRAERLFGDDPSMAAVHANELTPEWIAQRRAAAERAGVDPNRVLVGVYSKAGVDEVVGLDALEQNLDVIKGRAGEREGEFLGRTFQTPSGPVTVPLMPPDNAGGTREDKASRSGNSYQSISGEVFSGRGAKAKAEAHSVVGSLVDLDGQSAYVSGVTFTEDGTPVYTLVDPNSGDVVERSGRIEDENVLAWGDRIQEALEGQAETQAERAPEAAPVEETRAGITVDEATGIAADLGPRFDVFIDVMDSPADLSDEEREAMGISPDDNDTRAVFDPGGFLGEKDRVILFARNLTSKDEAFQAVLHEAVGHKGVRNLVGPDAVRVFREVYNLIRGLEEVEFDGQTWRGEELVGAVFQAYADRLQGASQEQIEAYVGDELLAGLAQNIEKLEPSVRDRIKEIIDRIIQGLRETGRRMGMEIDFSERDVRALLRQSARVLESGEAVRFDAQSLGLTDASTAPLAATAQASRPIDRIIEAEEQGLAPPVEEFRREIESQHQAVSVRPRYREDDVRFSRPNERVREAAQRYLSASGLPPVSTEGIYALLDQDFGIDTADLYASLRHSPDDPLVRESYRRFAEETLAQWNHLIKNEGVKFLPWKGEGQPYENSSETMQDVEENNRLYFFLTEQGYGEEESEEVQDHPLLEKTGIEVDGVELVYNDLFRAVHDYFGHAKEGYQFGPRGEFNAAITHSAMYSPLARPAMLAETHGQNSWVNFGEHLRRPDGSIPSRGEPGWIHPSERPYAEQKAVILPPEFSGVELVEQNGEVVAREVPSRFPTPNQARAASSQEAEEIHQRFSRRVTPEDLTYETREDAPAEAREVAAESLNDMRSVILRASEQNPINKYEGAQPQFQESRFSRRISDAVNQILGDDSRLIGLDIADELKEGPVTLVGRTVRNPADVMALTQALRDPRFETSRVILVRGNEIVGGTAISSRLAATTPVMPQNVMRRMDQIARDRTLSPMEMNRRIVQVYQDYMRSIMQPLGADGYYLLHNHPVGDPTPSQADVDVTRTFNFIVPGFRGHVIINSGRYTTITPEPGGLVLDQNIPITDDAVLREAGIDPSARRDLLLTPSIPSSWTGARISNIGDLAILARAMKNRARHLITGIDSRFQAVVLADANPAFFEEFLDGRKSFDEIADQLREFASNTGSTWLTLSGIDDVRNPGYVELVEKGLLLDAIDLDGNAASSLNIGDQSAQIMNPRMGLEEGDTPTLVEPDPGFRFSRPVEFPGDPSEVRHVAMLGGSTGATLVEDEQGNRFVRKEGNHPDHIREEVLADQIYRLVGVPVPEPRLYETPRGPVKLSPFISDATTLSRLHDRVFTDDASDSLFERARQALKQHFVLDALLSNVDVIGLGMDNILVDRNGTAYRIDNGSAMRFRAQGAPKPWWGPEVGELDSMRDRSINPQSALIFGDITEQEIRKQIEELMPHRDAIMDLLPDDLSPMVDARFDYLQRRAIGLEEGVRFSRDLGPFQKRAIINNKIFGKKANHIVTFPDKTEKDVENEVSPVHVSVPPAQADDVRDKLKAAGYAIDLEAETPSGRAVFEFRVPDEILERDVPASNPLTEPLTLVHYGASGLEVIDPAFQGRGAPSEELRGGPVPTNRSYYYKEGTETERRVLSLAEEKYVVTLQPGTELYNMADDPLGFGRTEDAITRIMEAGYDGFYNTASSLPGAVALFHPRAVEYVGYKTPSDYRGASTEGVVPVQRGVARLTVEFIPGESTSVLPGIRTAPFDQRLEYTRAVQELMTDPQTGENILLQEEGLIGAAALEAMGFYRGQINPMLVFDVGILPPDRPMPQDLRNRVERALAKIGLVAHQDSMGYSRGYYTDDPDAQNYILLDMGRTITFAEVRALGKLEPLKNDGVALISTSTGVSLLNIGGFDSNPEFAQWVQDEVTPLLGTSGRMYRAASDGGLIENDWTTHPNGEFYRRRAATEGSSIISGATDLLIEQVARINRQFGDRYGWNQAPGDLGARGGPGEVRGGGPADTGDGGDVRGDKAAERLGHDRRIRFSRPIRDLDELGFFSTLTRAVRDDFPGRGTAQSYRELLQIWADKGKFKRDELDWSGVMEWLGEHPDDARLTREDVAEFIDANKIEVRETVLDPNNPVSFDFLEGSEIVVGRYIPSHELLPRYQMYTTPGGFNYREYIFTLDYRQSTFASPGYEHGHFAGFRDLIGHARVKDRILDDGRLALSVEEVQSDWDMAAQKLGVVDTREIDGKISRLEDRIKERAIFHARRQREASEDYRIINAELRSARLNLVNRVASIRQVDSFAAEAALDDILSATKEVDVSDVDSDIAETDEFKEVLSLRKAIREAGESVVRLERERIEELEPLRLELKGLEEARSRMLRENEEGPRPVKANPFLNRATDFIMKRMVRLAAQGGYDAIIWPGSEEQTARYNGRARHEIFAGIEWRASLRPDRVVFDLVTELGDTILSDEAKIDDLSKYLPEKYVDQIRRARAEGFVEDYIEFPENERREIASKGMRVHYDTRLPAIAKKIGKRFGASPRQFQLRFADKVPLYQVMYNENVVAEVDSIDLANFIARELISAAERFTDNIEWKEFPAERNTVKYWEMSITPDLRESVMEKGFPRFYRKIMRPAPRLSVSQATEAERRVNQMFAFQTPDAEFLEQVNSIEPIRNEEGELLAPNGEVSLLNEFQWRAVRTENFKRFFGDWENDAENASKIVHPVTKEPVVLYHGTAFDFTEYDPERLGEVTSDEGYYGSGIYFAGDPESAKMYTEFAADHKWSRASDSMWTVVNKLSQLSKSLRTTGLPDETPDSDRNDLWAIFAKTAVAAENMKDTLGDFEYPHLPGTLESAKRYLKLYQNALTLRRKLYDMGVDSRLLAEANDILLWLDRASVINQSAGQAIMPVFINARNPLFIPEWGENWKDAFISVTGEDTNAWDIVEAIHRYGRRKFAEDVRQAGYDSVVAFTPRAIRDNQGFRELVVFNPTQIKSATGNIGTFSVDRADIRLSRAVTPGNPTNGSGMYQSPMGSEPVDHRTVIDAFQRALGTVIVKTKRSQMGNRASYYDAATGAIRTASFTDFRNIVREVGRHLYFRLIGDHVFGLPESERRSIDDELEKLGAKNRPQKASKNLRARTNKFRSDGMALFVSEYMRDPTKAATMAPRTAQVFNQMLDSSPAMRDGLEEARQLLVAYNSQDPADRAAAAVYLGVKAPSHGNLGKRITRRMEDFYSKWIDDNYPLYKIMVDLNGGVEPEHADENFYLLSRLAAGSYGKALAFLHHGVVTLEGTDPATGQPGRSVSLRDALKPVASRIEAFQEYAVAKRALELLDQIDAGLRPDMPMPNGATREDFQALIKRYEDSGDAQDFETAFAGLQSFNRSIIEYAVSEGLLSRDQADVIEQMNQNYIPWYRVQPDAPFRDRGTSSSRAFANQTTGFQRLKGSEALIDNPLEYYIANIFHLVNAVERNRVMQALYKAIPDDQDVTEFIIGDQVRKVPTRGVEMSGRVTFDEIEKALKKIGVTDEILDEIQAETGGISPEDIILHLVRPQYLPDADKYQVRVMVDGEPRFMELDAALYEAVTKTKVMGRMAESIIRFFSRPATWLRRGATGWNPAFILPNVVRDTPTRVLQSDVSIEGTLKMMSLFDPVKVSFGLIFGDEEKGENLYWRFVRSGGYASTIVSLDRDYVQGEIDKMRFQSDLEAGVVTGVIANPGQAFKAMFRGLEQAAEYAENVNRIAEYDLVYRKEKADALARGMDERSAERHAVQVAALAARDVTVDFARMGEYMRIINRVVPFSNAQVQGFMRFVEAWANNPARAAVTSTMYLVVPTIIAQAIIGDNPWYDELPDYLKDRYWNLPNPMGEFDDAGYAKTFIRIPKPHTWGILIGSSVERAIRFAMREDPTTMQDLQADIYGWFQSSGEQLPIDPSPIVGPMFFDEHVAPDADLNIMMRTFKGLQTFLGIQLFLPLIEVATNFDVFRERNIVPYFMDRNLEPQQQYTETDSPTAVVIGKALNVSPKHVQHLIYGYTAGLGQIALSATDVGMRDLSKELTGARLPQPAESPLGANIPVVGPVIKAFIVENPGYAAQSIRRYFDIQEAGDRAKATYKDILEREGRIQAVRYREKHKSIIRIADSKEMKNAKKQMKSLRELLNATITDEEMDPVERRRRLDAIYENMVKVSRDALDKFYAHLDVEER